MRMRSRRMRVPAGRRLVSPGAGGAAGFTPDRLDGLVLWLDPARGLYQERTGAGATTPAAADGDPVGTWLARTGQYFTAASDAARPTLRTAGGAHLQFDGVDDLLVYADVLSAEVVNFTMASVVALTGTAAGHTLFFNGEGSANGYGPAARTTGNFVGWLRGGVAWDETTTAADTSAHHYLVARTAAGVATVYRDGVALSPTFAGAPNTPTTRSYLGGHTSSSPSEGLVCEAVFYSRELSGGEIATLSDYFRGRWGTP